MPVILRPEDEEQWLDASRTPFAKAKSVLKSYPEELMDAHDVSPIVNSAKYDARSASNLFPMTRCLPPGNCLYFDDDFSLYPLALMQLSKTCCWMPTSAKVA